MFFNAIQDITPTTALQLLQTDPTVVILDVREAWEQEIVHIPGSCFIPLGKLLATSVEEILEEFPQLAQASQIMTLCHHGVRSKQGAAWLHGNKLPVLNIQGGIHAWAQEADPSLMTY